MEFSFIIILVALIQYQAFGLRTGIARGKYAVPPPKCTVNDTWERIFRVHQNTMEQLVVFVPAQLLFSYYVSARWAILPGVAFLIARQTYSHMYLKNPMKRGFAFTFMINAVLVIGSLIGVIVSVVKAA